MPFAGCPSPRAAHGMCLIGSKLVVFGGRDSVGRKNDLFVLDTGMLLSFYFPFHDSVSKIPTLIMHIHQTLTNKKQSKF